jgi:hypothetical protein
MTALTSLKLEKNDVGTTAQEALKKRYPNATIKL